MGMDARITLYSDSQDRAEKGARAAYDRIAALDTMMSDYRKDSELNRLSDGAGGHPKRVSRELFRVLQRAQEVSKNSDGAFDVTIGPLITLWRSARRSGKLPGLDELTKARASVGWEKMILDPKWQTVHLTVPGMRLDLGGIAKGYACDEAQKVLKRNGINRAIVEFGGDITVSGPPPGKKGWTIRVPNAGDDQGPKDMEFANCSVGTSGDTAQFTVIGGVQYSHVVDPQTGWALTNRVQATIIGKEGLTTDPVSTALTVIAESKRTDFLRNYRGVRTYFRTLKGTGGE